ncbi:hypothetical protein DOY81_008312 [Sarcophaga bullata]|nr:hypothetical protein DOY81_009874 [Sarcophaga bullata]TMW46606.1 hypothetical protein DOY81_008312 [Sarcophaga bullata]
MFCTKLKIDEAMVFSVNFKMPEIPSNHKRNLKRNVNSEHQNSSAPKKRSTVDCSGQHNITQIGRKNYPHITANSPQSNSSVTIANVGERKQKQSAADVQDNQHILKQRFFHHQHQITKQKLAKKAAANNAVCSNTQKRHATPAKSGRRANQKIQQQQQKQNSIKQQQMEAHQQQQQQQMQIDLTAGTASTGQTSLTQQQLDMQFVNYAVTHHQPPQQIFMEKELEPQLGTLPAVSGATSGIAMPLATSNPPSLITPLSSPHIAVSKRDITKNANKLHQNQQFTSNVSPSLPSVAPMSSHDIQTGLGNILSSTSAQLTSEKCKLSEKSLITTTPVQKYIVEERQPCAGALVNLQNSQGPTSSTTTTTTTTTHIIQVSNAAQQPQIMSLPQFSAAATKLRAVNTTLIAPGAKITSTPTKRISPNLSSSATGHIGSSNNSSINAGALHELANVASTQNQVLHIVDAGVSNNPTNVSHATPLHTPPAVIQIHNTTGASTATTSDISATATQSKVLTTKILPLVLAGPGNQNNANSTILSSSALVVASSPTSSVSVTSTTSNAGGTTIIKNLPSSMVLNTSTANLTPVTVASTNNTLISTLGAGATVFRKPPNIIKTSVAAGAPTKSTSPSSAPHIISNVKLTPVNVTPSSAVTHITTPSTFKNVIPSTSGMVRTSVKICQSPNGKVFIQPAGLVDSSKMKLGTNSVPHKIISSTSTANNSNTTGSGQRIAIQKVQIIPAPIGGSTASGSAIQSTGNHLNTKTGKSNMIFMPTSSSNVRPVTLSKMGNNILLKSSANQQITPTSPTAITADNTMAKSNIVVLGPSPTTPVKEQSLKLENTQLINEDTPLDILNMPIVMDPGVGVTSVSSATETVTVLPNNIIDASNVNTSSNLSTPIILDQTPINSSKTVVLNVDWEMKLDIEQQNQYNNKNHKQKRTVITSSGNQAISPSSSSNTSTSISSHGTKIKRLNKELISLEVKPKETTSSIVPLTTSSVLTTTTTTTSNPSSNMIVLDDSFDDVIVEEHDDDTSSITSLDKQQQQHRQHQNQNNDNDVPKILDMQIYQQHDGHDNRVADPKYTNTNDDDIDVSDGNENGKQSSRQFVETLEESTRTEIDQKQSQQIHHGQHNDPRQLQHSECEIDAGFDETIVTEIDENTAIEYIEEDGINSNVSLISDKSDIQRRTSINDSSATTTTTTTTTVISNQDNTKSSNISTFISNYTLSTSESTGSSDTTTAANNAISETIANDSATQQVEP